MIPIKRTAEPPFFLSTQADEARRAAQARHERPPASRGSGTGFEWFASQESLLLAALRTMCHDKCAWCETPLAWGTPVVVGYRPWHGVEDPSAGYLPDHYWARAFAWDNFLVCCNFCARYKGNRFPVGGTRAAPDAQQHELAAEQPMLLDPCADEPSKHLLFQPDGQVIGRTDRGRQTIEMLGLNRGQLVEARLDEAQRFAQALEEGMHVASGLILDDRAFVALKRELMLAHLASPKDGKIPALEATQRKFAIDQAAFESARAEVSTESQSGFENYNARARFVERVQIRNFLSIESLDLNLAGSEAERAPCFAVLGDNGVGKSSVLKAIALTLGGASYAKRLELQWHDLLRRGAQDGHVSIWTSGFAEPAVMYFRKGADELRFEQAESRALVLGYGSSRLLPTRKHRPKQGMKHAKIDNLFDPFLPMSDAESWLAVAPQPQFEEAALRIGQLLLLPEGLRIVRTDAEVPEVFIESAPADAPGQAPTRHPFAELSDGYQSMLGFAADLMQIMFDQGYQSMASAQGVVLVDELGNHLHPRWRMQVVERLRGAFPQVQFVFSTHDPLCLRGLRGGETVVLRLDAQRDVYALTDLPSVAGMRVDQLLGSEHFGLGSTIEPEMQRDYDRYLVLKSLPAPDEAQAAEREALGRRLFDLRLLADSPMQRAALQVMDEACRQGPALPERTISVSRLNEDARSAVRRLLQSTGAGAGRAP